ncbi:MAG: hypothetical protein CM1200mP2_43900 [Planctomycetaceae bacterium]|nr:MAG: hypothetical protein CM1200mP2_43900 [Planctomycetaceae bacterium]
MLRLTIPPTQPSATTWLPVPLTSTSRCMRHRPGNSTAFAPVPYKAYMGPRVGDLFFSTLANSTKPWPTTRGCSVSFHCEDPELLEVHATAETHEKRRPNECEVSATRFALEMIEKYGLTGKLCHYSVGEGLPLIRSARDRGLSVTCEVTPHHIYYDTSVITDENRGMMQMNPPLRAGDDRLAMLEGLRDGTLDYLATDHAPHTLEEKATGVSGQPHLDTYGAFVSWMLVRQASPRNASRRSVRKIPAPLWSPTPPLAVSGDRPRVLRFADRPESRQAGDHQA